MGLADRSANATRPTNSLREATGEGLPRASTAPAGDPPQDAPSVPAAAKKPTDRAAPDPLAGTYYVEDTGGERRYYEDDKRQSLALRANDRTISSKREDLATIRAMLALAEARGWMAIAVQGSADFRRVAWIEAQACGLDAHGYTATALDRQEADRRRAERGPSNAVRPAAVAASGPAERADPARPATPDVATQAAGRARQRPKIEGVPNTPSPDNARKALRAARTELSPDGRLVLAALSEKIERQMNRINGDAKADLKRFVATELLKKERTGGPVVLTAAQTRAARAPEPARTDPAPVAPLRRTEPDPPRRSR